jgi:hypothetical protein
MEDMAADGRFPSGSVVPALSRPFAAFPRQDYSTAIDAIEPVPARHARVGGSRAQRDLVEFTLLAAYARVGRVDDIRRALRLWRTGRTGVPVAGLTEVH